MHCFPVDANGNLSMDYHQNWMQLRRDEEDTRHNVTLSPHSNDARAISLTLPTPHIAMHVNPHPQDVLFGRGWPLQNHPGNIRFREVTEQYADAYYNSEDKAEKRKLAVQIVHRFLSSGSRFLRPDGKYQWLCVDEKTAYQKVCQCFRTLRGKGG
jgi:hypothetical protein